MKHYVNIIGYIGRKKVIPSDEVYNQGGGGDILYSSFRVDDETTRAEQQEMTRRVFEKFS